MYIIVRSEQNEDLDVVKESEFGQWLERRRMGIVSFISSEDICSAIVGILDE